VLTPVLFLSLAAIRLLLGAWLDRFAPRRVQAVQQFDAIDASESIRRHPFGDDYKGDKETIARLAA